MRIPRLWGLVTAVTATFAAGCGPATVDAASRWNGTIDTLESGTVMVSNPAEGVWGGSDAWRVVEELRVGALEGDGPDLFGRISDLAVDATGRMYVFEGQAQELRVFDASGEHVRTVGRKGGGPGEFNQMIGMTWAPDGTLWLVDPQNNRISIIDTAGTYVGSHQTIGGFMIVPWPGGFDDEGYFYTYAPDRTVDFGIALVRYGHGMQPVDTIRPPTYPGEGVFFELRRGESFMRAGVPFRDRLEWLLTPRGDIWAMLTGEYRLFRVSRAGDTVRSVTREFEPIPVTGEDIDRAIEEDLRWFRQEGGKVERSKFPDTKPATTDFFIDDEGYLWVVVVTSDEELEDRVLDVFDPAGRYLGQVRLPFAISRFPRPVFRDGMLYSVTRDDLEVPYVVRARIKRP